MSEGLVASVEPLAQVHDLALVDLDGTLYVGNRAVPGAPAALAVARQAGLGVAYVTNNASRTPQDVAGQLRGLGFAATDDDVTTSAQAAAALLAERLRSGSRVLVVGGAGLRAAVAADGLTPVDAVTDDPEAVVQGWAPELSWRMLAQGAYALARGVPWVATNTDRTLPTADGIAPGNGAFVALLADLAGRQPDEVAGKPEPGLLVRAAALRSALRPLVVGDRLDTDVEGAVAAGQPALLVLTGVSTVSDLLAARPGSRPSYVSADLHGLLAVHPAPTADDAGGFRCGGWRCTVTADGTARLQGAGDPLDALRAACSASWAAQDAGLAVASGALAGHPVLVGLGPTARTPG